MRRARRSCAWILSSRLAIIAISLAFCVLVDKSSSHLGAPAAGRGGGQEEREREERERVERARLERRTGDLQRKEDAAAWFAQRKLSVSKKEPERGVVQPQPGAPPRLAQLVLTSPRYAINATDVACSPEGAAAADDGSETTGRPLVLIWVYSAPANVEARTRVRRTWGSVRRCEGFALRVVFFVGRRSPGGGDGGGGGGVVAEDRPLVDENREHGDIVQDVSYVDSYENLSLKGASGLRWMSKYCSNALFAVKVDDDTLVSPFALVRYLRSADLARDIACKLQVRARPQRQPDKWFEDPLDFPDRLYPVYCQGFAYIFSMNIAQLLEGAVGKTRVPRMEDVYVTGVLAQFAGIGHKPLPKSAWMIVFPNGYEKAIDNQTGVIFVSDTFIPSRVDYFWQKQKKIYKWKA